ncbi:MAG: NADAR family protein [Hyphomicrobiaceae bacterium]|nr:MAG: NADAR family protein [Hyphomicrobiaceae bacterium]
MMFRDRLAFLSNFFPCVIESNTGIKFPSVENAYQWAKEVDPDNREFVPTKGWERYDAVPVKWTEYMTNCSAGDAKSAGRRANMRPNWNEIKVEVMRRLLKQKFQPGTNLGDRLRATRNMILVEGNTWHDNFWGSCTCPRCGDKGENMLGKLLMERRAELRKEDK